MAENTTPKNDEHDEDVEFVDSYDDLNVADLKTDLDDRGIPYKSRAKKPELIALLEADDAENEDDDADPEGTEGQGEGHREKTEAGEQEDPAQLDDPEDPDEPVGQDLGRHDSADREAEGAGRKPLENVKKAVDVIKGNEYIRTYSEEVHGKGYEQLAKGFAHKKGAKLVPADKISKLKITYRVKSKALGAYYNKTDVFDGPTAKEDALFAQSQLPQNVTIHIV